MSMLEEYTNRCMQSRGLAFQANLVVLRSYVKIVPDHQFEFYTNRINLIEELKMLWAAGLRKTQQEIVLARYKQLTGKESIT